MPVRRKIEVKFNVVAESPGVDLLLAKLAETRRLHPEIDLEWDLTSKPVECHACGSPYAFLTDPYMRQWCRHCAQDTERLIVYQVRREELT